MSGERHERLKAIFAEVCGLSQQARAARLDELCAGDDELREEAESLLGHDAQPAVDFDGAASVLREFSATDRTMPRADHLERIGAYRVRSVLGEGGMGVVYLADQESPQRTVALKLIRPGTATPSILRRFANEADLLGRLQHPGIAQVFEVGTADLPDGTLQPYFTMEYVPGDPLNRYADMRRLSRDDRVRLLIKVCAGVQHAHQNGIIHRDLKPSNIIVRDSSTEVRDADSKQMDGQPKILDFGVARSMTAADRTVMTAVGEIVGTMTYMSPEQSAGRLDDVDARSDVYSLGVIAYELLSGKLPHDTRHDALPEAARRIAEEAPPRLSTIDRGLRGDLETIVAKAIEKDPARRYQSAPEFAADLDRYLSNEPVLARPPSAIYQMHKFARRHRGLVTAFLLLVITIAAGGLVSATGWVRADAENERANLERDTTKAVNDFLTDMLASIDPNSAEDPDVKLRDVLDAAAAKIEDAFPDRPLIRAELHATVGRTYCSLGLFEVAREHLLRALTIRQRDLGHEHEKVGDVLHDLMLAYKQDRLYRPALEYAQQLVAVDEALFGPEDLRTVNARVQEAMMLALLSRFDEAEPIFEESISLWRSVEPAGSSAFAVVLNEYGSFLAGVGSYARCEEMHLASLELHERHDGPDSLPASLAHVNLAGVINALGRSDEALDHLAVARRIREARLAPDHVWVTSLHHMEGFIRWTRGEITAAGNAFERSIDGQKIRSPDGDLSLVVSLKGLGDVRKRQGHYDEAIALFDEALVIVERDVGPAHMFAGTVLNSRAMACSEAGRLDEARADAVRAIEIVRAAQGESSARLAAMQNGLAGIYMQSGELDEAFDLFETALHMHEAARPGEELRRSNYVHAIATVNARLGDLAAARAGFEEALAARRAHAVEGDPLIAASLQSLAAVQARDGDAAAAEANALDALAIYDVVYAGAHRAKAACLVALGSTLCNGGDAVAGERELRAALDMYAALAIADGSELAGALFELASCLIAQERKADAGALLREAWGIMENDASNPDLRGRIAEGLDTL